jgi:protein phosphatase
MSGSAPAPRRRRPLRTALLALATLVVLGAVAIGGYLFVMGHWFVGVQEDAAGEPVAVFQGLHASIIGLDLYRLDSGTTLVAGDLTPAARSRVTAGIAANDRADAQRILDNLRGQQLPVCRTTPLTTAPSTTTDDATTTPADPALPPAPGAPALTSAPPATAAAPPTTTSPARSGGSEVGCRKAD